MWMNFGGDEGAAEFCLMVGKCRADADVERPATVRHPEVRAAARLEG
jgi:hypothetical protein